MMWTNPVRFEATCHRTDQSINQGHGVLKPLHQRQGHSNGRGRWPLKGPFGGWGDCLPVEGATAPSTGRQRPCTEDTVPAHVPSGLRSAAAALPASGHRGGSSRRDHRVRREPEPGRPSTGHTAEEERGRGAASQPTRSWLRTTTPPPSASAVPPGGVLPWIACASV